MEHYIVSARKYRPSTFGTVIGQKPLTAALKHAIATDRLAHAYLFCGSRGVGKTSCARIFAKTINCEHRTADGEACNECESCRAFNEGSSLNIIELDAASHNGIDDMKALIEQVMVPPRQGRYRVFIIDEVHMLSQAAFNAFLKTLEEPPEYVIFILATTEKHKIIPTILSRCQIYDFSRITIQDMVEHLQRVAKQEGIAAETSALGVIARKADGAMRDALSIFDQVAASSLGNVTYQNAIENLNILDSTYYSRLVEAFIAGDVPAALLIYKEVRDKGFDSQFFINGLGQYFRDLMVARQPATINLLEAGDEEKAQIAEVAQKCQPTFIYKAMDLCNEADLNYRTASNKQFLIELTLIKLCQLCSPSPGIDGGGEGQLKPIAARQSTPTPAAASNDSMPKPAPQPPTPRAQEPSATYSPSVKPTVRVTAPNGIDAPKRPTISLSIKPRLREQESAKPEADAPVQTSREAYSDADLMKAWTAYAEAHPKERILANTILATKLHRIDGDSYFVAVDDAIQVNVLNESKPEILAHLRSSLKNDFIDFEARIAETESSPVTWTQKEVLQHMVKERPALASLIRDLGFTLA